VKVTDVKIRIRSGKGAVKAIVSVTLDDCFAVHGLRIIEGKTGFHVAMPSERPKISCPKCSKRNEVGSKYCHFCGFQFQAQEPSNEHRDIAHPINQETRSVIEKAVIEAYQKAAEEGGACEAPEQEQGGKRSVLGGLLGLFRSGEEG